MASSPESARQLTFAGRTARFWSVNRQGGPSGLPPRLFHGLVEGIVDFTSHRAITRTVPTGGGGLVGRLTGARSHGVPPIYMLFDGPSARACLFGRWQELPSNAPFEPVSGPAGLRFLNLMLPETIIEAMEGGEDEVRSEPATRYRLKLDVDRMQWPTPEHSAVTPRGLPLVGRLLSKALPDPRPQGILSAEVWLDDAGRLVRFSHNDLPTDHPKHRQALWTTTELWDFGIPPPLSNWKTQPVIDPMTLQFPQTEAEFMHLARPKPDTPDR